MATWTEHDIIANGIKIHYLRTGQGDKPALVGARQARWIVEKNPMFEVAKIAGAGHNFMDDNFADYIQAVRGFLARFN